MLGITIYKVKIFQNVGHLQFRTSLKIPFRQDIYFWKFLMCRYIHMYIHSILATSCYEETPLTMWLLQKKIFNWGLSYSFGGLVHDHHDRKQKGVALDQYLRALNPDMQATDRERDWAWSGLLNLQCQRSVTHLLHQGHISYPSQMFTNWAPSIQIHEPMEAVMFSHFIPSGLV